MVVENCRYKMVRSGPICLWACNVAENGNSNVKSSSLPGSVIRVFKRNSYKAHTCNR